MKLKRFMTKLVTIIRPHTMRGFNNLISHASNKEVTQNSIINSNLWDMPNSVLLKIRNKRIPSNSDPTLAIIESIRHFPKRSNLKSTITTVSMTRANIPVPSNSSPTLTRLQSMAKRKLSISRFYFLKIKQNDENGEL
jgi:hypothetical protein